MKALATKAAELATVSEKSQLSFEETLRRWFHAELVRGAKLVKLTTLHKAGVYDAFEDWLNQLPDSSRIDILAKIDPYRPELQMSSKADGLTHLRRLASQQVKPAPKPKVAGRKPSYKKSARQTNSLKNGILLGSKY